MSGSRSPAALHASPRATWTLAVVVLVVAASTVAVADVPTADRPSTDDDVPTVDRPSTAGDVPTTDRLPAAGDVGAESPATSHASASTLSAPGNRSLDELALPEDATRTEFVQHADWIVLAFETNGVTANLSSAADLNASAPTDGVSVSINETYASTGTGEKRESVPVEAFTLVRDLANDRVFLVGKQTALPNVDRGEVFRATLRVDASENPQLSLDAEATTTVRVSEYLASVDGAGDDRLRVPQSTVAEVTGTTTVPAGEEIYVRVRNTGEENPFLRQKTVTVTENGSWQASFNLSAVPAGTEFHVSLLNGGATIARTDAVVVASVGSDLAVASFDAPSIVTTDEAYAVAVGVRNAGSAPTSTVVEYVRGGDVVESRVVTVAANATEVVTFEVDPARTEGEVTHAVVLGAGERRNATLTVVDDDTTATGEPSERPNRTGTGSGTTVEPTASVASDSQSGFGAILALVATLAVALVRARRGGARR